MADIQPTPKKISQVKKDLLNPATTSHFLVSVGLPSGGLGAVKEYQKEIGLNYDQERLNILCAQASLPGSRLLTAELNNNFPGVTERHVYRRSFDESTNLTFYVDADQYLPIRFFESWMNYITFSTLVEDPSVGGGSIDRETFSYRVRFPKEYKGNLEITKFEKNLDFGGVGRTNIMTYKFVNVFPLAINSIPVSYDTSRLLKCTVAMAYSRYFVTQGATGKVKTIQPSTDARGRDFDNQFFGLGTEDPPTIFSVDPFGRSVVERNRSTQIGDFNLSPIG